MGEHLPCKQGVKGSNPFISTDMRNHVKRRIERSEILLMNSEGVLLYLENRILIKILKYQSLKKRDNKTSEARFCFERSRFGKQRKILIGNSQVLTK